MKQIFLSLIMLLLPMLASADKVQIDGIYYNLDAENKTAEVTYGDWDPSDDKNSVGRYSGRITLPGSVNYEDVKYRVTSIGVGAFEHCYLLEWVNISNYVTSIGKFAFAYSGIQDVAFPVYGPTAIDDYAFFGCDELNSVTISDCVTSIGNYAFSGCGSLSLLTIGNGVTSIGDNAFSHCFNLYSVKFGNSVTSIGKEAFYSCTELESVTIPDCVTSIGESAFKWCSSMNTATIGNGVTTIGDNAFLECLYMKSVTIGESVSEIGNYAFKGCDMYHVYCYAEKPPHTGSEVFNGSYRTLHVHKDVISDYMAADTWMNFNEIVSIEGPDKCATPVINFIKGTIELSCETEGVEYVTEISIPDVNEYTGNKIKLTGTYTISVYATKEGYDNSDVATREINLSGNGSSGVSGDLNGDNVVNIADVITFSNYLLRTK